ncbi:hypothetical protein [Streptomyces avermitilis]|uniref:hypothetical protein n=1 Tax=Streptomyces avermitilis TaxID=33903 RepID=UPI00380087F5
MEVEERYCAGCLETKPLTAEHWEMRQTKNHGARPMYRVCRVCRGAIREAQRARDPEAQARHLEQKRAEKERRKSADPDAFRAREAELQRERRERLGEAHKARHREYMRAYRRRKKQEGTA